MKLYESIDDLLEIVDPKLVYNYETLEIAPDAAGYLRRVNEEYKKTTKDLEDLYIRCSKLFVFVSVVGGIMAFTSSIALMSIDEPIESSFMQLFKGLSPLLLSLILYVHYPESKKKQTAKIQERLGSVLQAFRDAVELLRSPVGRTIHKYDEATVRDNFLTYAVQIVDAENKLDKVRRMKERDVFEMAHLCNWIIKRREEFADAERSAKSFGLKFDKSELFTEAKGHIERTYGR